MTINPDQVTVIITRSRKLLLDISELIEAFNTELEIIEARPRSIPAPLATTADRGQEEENIATDIVPLFSVGDRVRITNRVTTFPSLPNRGGDRARSPNLGVIVKITASRVHVKLDGHPSRTIQRHPANIAHLV
jgi:hypothetical protein